MSLRYIKPRPITPEEGVRRLLTAFAHHAERWANDDSVSRLEACNGVVFSILAVLDGNNLYMPAFDLTPRPHVSDRFFCRSRGENWWVRKPINTTVHLHAEWKKFERSSEGTDHGTAVSG